MCCLWIKFCENYAKYTIQSEKKGATKELILKQSVLLEKIHRNEVIEEKVAAHLLEQIKYLELHKEFNISKSEYQKILREKDVENHFVYIFQTGIQLIKREILKLHTLIENQFKSPVGEDQLNQENQMYLNIEALLQKALESKKKIKDYFTESNRLAYNKNLMVGAQIISKLVRNVMFRIDVEGLENIPTFGPCILYANHTTAQIDPILITTLTKRKIFFMASLDTFVIGGKVVHKLGAIPVDVESFMNREKKEDHVFTKEQKEKHKVSMKESIDKVMIHLKHGDVVGIFPEGDSYEGGAYVRKESERYLSPHEGYIKILLLAYKMYKIRASLIPNGLNYGPKGLMRNVQIRIGKPINISTMLSAAKEKDDAIQRYTKVSFNRVKKLAS